MAIPDSMRVEKVIFEHIKNSWFKKTDMLKLHYSPVGSWAATVEFIVVNEVTGEYSFHELRLNDTVNMITDTDEELIKKLNKIKRKVITMTKLKICHLNDLSWGITSPGSRVV